MTYLAATSFGILISSVLKSSESAVLPVLFIIISQVVLSGALMDLPKNIEWLSSITIAKWSLGALGEVFDIRGLAQNYQFGPQPLRAIYETPFAARDLCIDRNHSYLLYPIYSKHQAKCLSKITNPSMPTIEGFTLSMEELYSRTIRQINHLHSILFKGICIDG